MKDNTTAKLILVVVAVLAVGVAIWTGLGVRVEGPAQAMQRDAFRAPF